MKKRLRQLLEQRDTNGITALAADRRRTLGVLTSLTYDADPQIVWRAIEAMGLAASRIAQDDPEFVREHLRRLLWLISEESGGQCWRAPEAMAEVVRHRPDLFGDYAPIVVFLLREMAEEDLEHFRPGILWAIGRLGTLAGDHVGEVLPAITAALDDSDPQARGMAVWCLERLGRADLLAGRPDLAEDEDPVDLYEDGRLEHTSVGRLSRRVLGS
ncbi:MAG: DVU0298 family protein [Planctomycetota bacterium]